MLPDPGWQFDKNAERCDPFHPRGKASGKICLCSIKKPVFKGRQPWHYNCTALVIAPRPILALHVHLWSVFILYAASFWEKQNHLLNVVSAFAPDDCALKVFPLEVYLNGCEGRNSLDILHHWVVFCRPPFNRPKAFSPSLNAAAYRGM